MLKFNFSKPKKVFEKLNKMDRKQAYTIGAIVVVAVVALLMLVSAMGGEDDSFEGMQARGYDLAQMPFVNDEAEKYLLAAKYPDMRENASTLLYSAEEKEARQEADEEASAQAQEDEANNYDGFSAEGGSGAAGSGSRGYGGYGGGRGGRTRTEIGTLGTASMGSASGSGVNSTYGPSGDFRQFGKKEGYVAPAQLKTDNARNALGQFRSGSYAANRLKDNKMVNARRAAQGASFQGSNAFTKEGIDVEKLGGLGLDTDAPPTTSDLSNLDKQVQEAAKDAEKKQEQKAKDELSWWEQMLQDLVKQAASALVGSVMDSVGDSIKGTINGNSASRAARKQYGAEQASKSWGELTEADQAYLNKKYNGNGQAMWEGKGYTDSNGKQVKGFSDKQKRKSLSGSDLAWARGGQEKSIVMGQSAGKTDSTKYIQKTENNEGSITNPCGNKRFVPKGDGQYVCE